jgi:peptide chain release factor 1
MPVSRISLDERLLVVRGRLTVDHPAVFGIDRADFVHRVAEHVHDAAEGGVAHRHLDAFAGVAGHQAALQAVGGAQRDGAHHAVAQHLLHFQRDLGAVDLQCVIHLRHLIARELDVDDRADDLNNFALAHWGNSTW